LILPPEALLVLVGFEAELDEDEDKVEVEGGVRLLLVLVFTLIVLTDLGVASGSPIQKPRQQNFIQCMKIEGIYGRRP
jgi:hypothetical protein